MASFTKTTIIVRNGGNAAAGVVHPEDHGGIGPGGNVHRAGARAWRYGHVHLCLPRRHVFATVDQTNVVAESNETNNTASLTNRTCP